MVLFALVLVALLGMVGLVIDGGLMMAMNRRTQNAADSGALAAALNMMRGGNAAGATTDATTFVQTHNGLADATVTVNIPPTSGPFAGQYRYAEVIVTKPIDTIFVQLLGLNQNHQVVARAVAGYEAVASGEGMIALDPHARPGVDVNGGATLRIDGAITVNSGMAGLDQYGAVVDWGGEFSQQYGMTTLNGSIMQARHIQLRGGVDTPTNYQPYVAGDPNPLFARAQVGPDPLRDLPVPRPSNTPSITNWTRQPPVVVPSGVHRVLTPGVYEDIQINQGGTLNFSPGVYVFSPTQAGQGLRSLGNNTITGFGILFYMAGSNYLDVSPGHWDTLDDTQAALDGPLPPTNAFAVPGSTDPNPDQVHFAILDFNATGSNVMLKGLIAPGTVFNDMIYFQRRRNMTSPSIQGVAGVNVNFLGTIYAKWGHFRLTGSGIYYSQFIVARMTVTGSAPVTIYGTGRNFGSANQVFLVE